MYKYKLILFVFLCFSIDVSGQKDTGIIKRTNPKDSGDRLNMDAIYNRPFLRAGKFPVAIGGYLEANSNYASTDGISEGLAFQMKRMTIFLSSTIAPNIKFLSEIEFEDGTKEINIEFAAMDIEFDPMLNLRGGIFMNPIGSFNQNHDGPRWEFIDRPISSTNILPATLSNVGFGLHGKHYSRHLIFGYEAYLSNGFDDKIISNGENRTSLGAGKLNPARFEDNNSGEPMFTGKLAFRNRNIGELGLSMMSGTYNKYISDGLKVDDKRGLTAIAIDFNTSLFKNRLQLNTELVRLFVDIPETYTQQYGNQQDGLYFDCIYTLVQKKILSWDKAKINTGFRFEYADYNVGKFKETGTKIGDEVWAIVPCISFRPVGSTVLRFNYRYGKSTDLLGNPPAVSAAYQLGFSTYF